MGNGKHPSYVTHAPDVPKSPLCLPAITAGRTTLDARVDSRVLIIGAGIAVLPAAQDLVQRRAEVIVVDARDRIGRRVDRHADGLGARWMHCARGNPLATPPVADFT